MDKRHIYSRVAYNYYYADKNSEAGGSRKELKWNGKFKDRNISFYAEYGLTERLTALTSLYYKKIKKEDNYIEMETDGIGDIDLGLKYAIFKGNKGVISVQGLLKIPETYDKKNMLPLGNGQYDYEFRLLLGKSLWPAIPGYLNIEIGYRWRAQ